jgi:hypothetical protein
MNDLEKMISICDKLDIPYTLGKKRGIDKLIMYDDDYEYLCEMTYNRMGRLVDERFFKIIPLDKE